MPAAKSRTTKTAKASNIRFVTGSDEAAVKKAALALVQQLAPNADAFGLETIDGAVDSVDAATSAILESVNALLTIPFLDGSKLVWLKSASFLSDTVTGRSETVLSALEKLCDLLAQGLPAQMIFLISAPRADKRRTAYTTLSKLADTQICDLPNLGFRAGEEDFIEWTTSRVHQRDLQLAPDALAILTARVGLDAGQLDNELTKLETAFGKSRPVTSEDVRRLVPQTREGGIFDLSEALGHRNLPLALETFEQLYRQGEKTVALLLAAIVPTVRNLLLAKDLLVRHRLKAPVQPHAFARPLQRLSEKDASHLPRKKDGTLNTYAIGISAMHAAHYSLTELQAALIACADANQQLFSGTLTDRVIIVRLLIGIMARTEPRKA